MPMIPQLDTNYGPDTPNILLRAEQIKSGWRQAEQADRALQQEQDFRNAMAAYQAAGGDPAAREAAAMNMLAVSPQMAAPALNYMQKQQEWPLTKEALQSELASKRMQREEDMIKLGLRLLPSVEWDEKNQNWRAFRQYMIERGANPDIFPERFSTEKEFKDWKDRAKRAALTVKQQFELSQPRFGPVQSGVAPGTREPVLFQVNQRTGAPRIIEVVRPAPKSPPTRWGKPYRGKYGGTYQTNLTTGQVKKVSGPPPKAGKSDKSAQEAKTRKRLSDVAAKIYKITQGGGDKLDRVLLALVGDRVSGLPNVGGTMNEDAKQEVLAVLRSEQDALRRRLAEIRGGMTMSDREFESLSTQGKITKLPSGTFFTDKNGQTYEVKEVGP